MILVLSIACIPATIDNGWSEREGAALVDPDRKGTHAGDDAIEHVDGGEQATEVIVGDTGLGGGGDGGDGGEDGKSFWQLDEVRQIELTVEQQSYLSLQQDPYNYTLAEVTIDGEEVGEVGVRLKGESSYRPITQKSSFKLKFDWVDEEKQYDGLRRLTLHNGIYDPSFMHELTSHHVWQAGGLAAKRVGYAWVTLNGNDYGLYIAVDTADESFLKAFFDDPSGGMWEAEGADFYQGRCSGFELDEAPDDFDQPSIVDACAVGDLQVVEFTEALEEWFGQEGFFDYMGIEAAVAHWDGYGLNLNNWHVVYEPTIGKFFVTPHSTDLSWGWNPWDYGNTSCFNYQTDPRNYDNGRLIQRCNADADCKERLVDATYAAADLIEDEMDTLLDLIDDAEALIADYVAEDPRMEFTEARFLQHVECLREELPERPDIIRTRLDL